MVVLLPLPVNGFKRIRLRKGLENLLRWKRRGHETISPRCTADSIERLITDTRRNLFDPKNRSGQFAHPCRVVAICRLRRAILAGGDGSGRKLPDRNTALFHDPKRRQCQPGGHDYKNMSRKLSRAGCYQQDADFERRSLAEREHSCGYVAGGRHHAKCNRAGHG